MLQDIRDNTQGVIAKVIIGLIVAVFALWGV
ncbi:MAG: SurA N-terminal domain-containing protein, partial [Gammaproteobacteria bacterium]|nr:SurA N-terminal domain-containing protein [Gammaproteobacteria bacterium]